ncbi:MAG: hypothetical protein KDJ65_08805 [Anaerolineae bacterium]|nr:hypothetical protein [Anaerolineae bacterium]
MSDSQPHILDRWQIVEPSTAAITFSTTETSPVARWVLDLPSEEPAALARLQSLQTDQQAARIALNDVLERLEQLTSEAAAGESFSIQPDQAAPEEELLDAIAELRGEVSFAPGRPSKLKQIGGEFQAGTDRLFRLLSHLAWVETRHESVFLGRTVVGWSGDTHTLWREDSSSIQQTLHQRNLKLALSTRILYLRILMMSTQAAAKISLLLGSSAGVGSVMVLPIAWRYVNQVLRELDRHRNMIN